MREGKCLSVSLCVSEEGGGRRGTWGAGLQNVGCGSGFEWVVELRCSSRSKESS